MGRIIVTNHVTLDGVMQAPAAANEDTRGGFDKGGWAASRNDAVLGEAMGKGMASTGALLFGRRTYEHFYGFWPHQTDNPYTEVLNKTQKYVASRTLTEPLPWENSTLLQGDIAQAVADLEAHSDGDIAILGSGELIQTLLRHNLIDTFVLLIHPVVLGQGRRLFAEDGAEADLKLVDVTPTTTGVLIATYENAR